MNYVRNDGSTLLTATGTICDGTEGGHYNSCLHGGEMRRVPVTNRTSCDGLSASDALGAFRWRCAMVGGVPNMVTGGLAEERYLSHLISFAGAASWRPNAVTVSDSCGTAMTSSTVWYTNAIVKNFSAAPATLSLTGTGTIYIFSSDPAKNLDIASSGVGLVSEPGLVITANGAGPHISTTLNFDWIEATTNSVAADYTLRATNSAFLRVHGSNFANKQTRLEPITSSKVSYTRQYDGQSLELQSGSHGNTFEALTITNTRLNHEFMAKQNNIFVDITIAGSDYGFSAGNFMNVSNFVLINHTGVNFSTSGLRADAFNDATFMNILIANAQGSAVTPAGTRNQFINLAIGNSDFRIDATGNNEYFTGQMRFGTNAGACSSGGALAGVTAGCAPQNASDFVTTTGLTFETAIRGKIVGGDTVNTVDTSGGAPFAGVTDFFRFQSRYRGYARDNAAAQFNNLHRGSCTSGTCRIWDMRLNASDNQLRAVLPLPTGNDYLIHRWSAADATACGRIKGAVWAQACNLPGRLTSGACTGAGGAWTDVCHSVALRNAYEITGDALGNDNGLCEANEACVYTPNIGSYQGQAGLAPMNITTSGIVAGVELWQYQQNGL